jgi:DNA-binding NarL/FixJ family response regulator
VAGCLRTGADGFLVKQDACQDILTSIRGTLLRTRAGDPQQSLTSRLRLQAGDRRDGRLSGGELTERERDVIRLLALGFGNQQIADRLDLKLGTVKTYVERIIGKLGVSSRVEAAVAAHALGLLSTNPS